MKIAVLGGAGRMGRWFVHYFISRGHMIIISDVKLDEARAFAKATSLELAKNNIEAAKKADLIMVSTPIQVTPKVIHEIIPHVRKGTVVAEISSFKAHLLKNLAEITRINMGILPLSIHPLFGPGTQKLEGKKIAVIPILNAEAEKKLVKELFPEASLIVVDAEEHDRAMALTLSLTHFINIAFVSILSKENLKLLKKLEGPTFKLQRILAESIMTEDPSLQASIQLDNKYAYKYLNKFLSKAETIGKWISDKEEEKITKLCNDLWSSVSKDVDFAKSYEKMYSVIERL